MRHQRAYGAALCGLTSAVIVSLALGSNVYPQVFAAARAIDTLIPGATLYSYSKKEQGDHFLMFKKPIKFTADLHSFLKR